MVLAFVPMYFTAADCGTTFTWAARAFGTRVGWMGGWAIIIADAISCGRSTSAAGHC